MALPGGERLHPVGQAGHGHQQVAAGGTHGLGRHPGVDDVGSDGGGHVGDERPRRGGPHQEVGAVGGRAAVLQREADVHRRIDDVAVHVGLAELVRRQGGATPGAVGRDLVALVQQPLLPQLREEPPHRLDVVVGQRPVGIGGVDPGARAGGQGRPVLDVALDGVAAVLVELGHPVGLDLVLGVEAELLLHLQLHRQAMAVPTALAGHVVTSHGLEAGVEVLEHPGPDVVQAGLAVGGGRSFVEDPGLGIGPLPPGLGDDVVLAPARQDVLLEGDQVEARVYGAERHSISLRGGEGSPNRALPNPALGVVRDWVLT